MAHNHNPTFARIPGLLGAIFRVSKARRNEIRIEAYPLAAWLRRAAQQLGNCYFIIRRPYQDRAGWGKAIEMSDTYRHGHAAPGNQRLDRRDARMRAGAQRQQGGCRQLRHRAGRAPGGGPLDRPDPPARLTAMVGRRLLAVAACLVGASVALAQTGQVEVSNAWARATPAKAENGVAYLTIRSSTPDRLVAASSPWLRRRSSTRWRWPAWS